MGKWTVLLSANGLLPNLTKTTFNVIIREINLDGVYMDSKLCFCGSGKKHEDCHAEIKENSAMAYLFEAFKIIDSDIKDGGSMPMCKKGCNTCCSDYFHVTPIEFLAIVNYIQKRETGLNLGRLHKKARKIMPNIPLFYDDNVNVAGFPPCIFLNNINGKCRIYEVRPLLCRMYGFYESFTDCVKAKGMLKFINPNVDEHLTKIGGKVIMPDLSEFQIPAIPIVYWFGNSFTESNTEVLRQLYMISHDETIHNYVKFIIDENIGFGANNENSRY